MNGCVWTDGACCLTFNAVKRRGQKIQKRISWGIRVNGFQPENGIYDYGLWRFFTDGVFILPAATCKSTAFVFCHTYLMRQKMRTAGEKKTARKLQINSFPGTIKHLCGHSSMQIGASTHTVLQECTTLHCALNFPEGQLEIYLCSSTPRRLTWF